MSVHLILNFRQGLFCRAGLMILLGLASHPVSTANAQIKKATNTLSKSGTQELKTKEFKADFDVLANSQGAAQVAYINELIEKMWQENKIEPSDRCSDYEFIRRASLDLIGRIAKVQEIERFLKDPPRERRSLLIERLLASEECAQNWATIWTVHLLTRSGSTKQAKEQLQDWLADKFMERKDNYQPDWAKIVIEMLTATGKTNENPAVNFILHHLGEMNAKDRDASGAYDMVPITSRTTRLFLGLRTQCVQCHDHPFNGDWGQHHFWGINAFFRQTDAPTGRPTLMVKKKMKGEIERQFELVDDPNLNNKGLVSYERRNALILYTDPTFLDGKKLKKTDPSSTRRMELARFITNSPYFAKVFVNRTWGNFFGRSFTKDYPDDFGDHNPITNSELLERLSEDWAKKYNHNPKDLLRWICNSRAYGLSSTANKSNDKPEDEVFFARMLLKSMSPEQLFDSLMTATQAKIAESRETKIALREDWLDKLIVSFGDDEGNEISYNGTVVQALMLMNGQDINQAIMDKKYGTVAAIIKKEILTKGFTTKTARDAVKDIYLAALNRPPTDKEYATLFNPKVFQFQPAFQKTVRDPIAFWTDFYQDMMWAVLNSNEFILNH